MQAQKGQPTMDAFNDQVLRAEAHSTQRRFDNWNERVKKRIGAEGTVEGQAITHAYFARTVATVTQHIDDTRKSLGPLKGLVPIVLQLPAEVLALYALQVTLHTIGLACEFHEAVHMLGEALEAACFEHGITKTKPRLAAKVSKAAKELHHRVKARRKAARKLAADAGYKVAMWSSMQRAAAGGWLMDLVLRALPEVFETVIIGEEKHLTITPEAEHIALVAQSKCLERMTAALPSPTPPEPWVEPHRGRDNLVASHYKATHAALRAACRNGTMQPHLNGVNALQAVEWRINRRMLAVLLRCQRNGIEVKGMPRERIEVDDPLSKGIDAVLRKQWWATNAPKIQHNLAVVSDGFMWAEDTKIARMFARHTFYTPMYCDFRGRVYATCHFNFQRDDRVRALFLFERGEPIGEDGLWWLKVHVANCAAFNTPIGKTDKLALTERVRWAEQNLTQIRLCSQNPLEHLWWTTADKPFLFLASCFELIQALDIGPSYVCHLPISFDGACSGLQHLSALTRAEKEAALVNLTPGDVPRDVYAVVASCVSSRVAADAQLTGWRSELASKALEFGIDRKVAKRNVMTYSYSASKFGMGQQQQEDLIDELASEVLTGDREAHPFAGFEKGWKKHPSTAARYLAGHVHAAIEEVVHRPAQAMTFLQKLAKALAHEGKVLKWTTPSGFPWSNRYHRAQIERLYMYMHDKGVKREHCMLVCTGNDAEVWKAKAASAVAPNFVHALDASHLVLTARRCAREGIELATVHDSFGCLPSQAARVNHLIREEFTYMYTKNDVLLQVYAHACKDIDVRDPRRWPELPEYGELNINEVMKARYAFA